MTRISKQAERRARSPRKHRQPSAKTGPLKCNLPLGYKEQNNALETEFAVTTFIAKVK